ncbi:MAG: hypothetical protein RL885_00160 [Planctomycetota bacterium]
MSDAGTGYEKKDIRLSAAAWLGGIIVILITAAALICAWLFGFFDERVTSKEVLRLPGREASEPSPPADVIVQRQALEHATSEQLGSFGWIDAEKDRVHLPIERAMQIIAEKGELPVFEVAEEEDQ